MKDQTDKLFTEYEKLHSSICKHTQARFVATTELIAEARRWGELKLQWQKYHNNTLSNSPVSSNSSYENGNCINVAAIDSSNQAFPQEQYANMIPSYQSPSYAGYYPPLQQSAPLVADYSDINYLLKLAEQKYSEYSSVLQQLSFIDNSLQSGIDSILYKVEIGQIIPDNIRELLDCYYCRVQKSCIGCQELNNCDTLKNKWAINVYYEYMNDKLDLSTIVKSAKDDFDIDFYNPIEPTSGFQFTSYPPMEDTSENTLYFTNEDGKAVMFVEYEISDSKITAIPNSYISNRIFPFSIPLVPAKLLNIKDIHEDAGPEIFFTDSLEFTRYAKPTVDGSIITSYYGGQFGNIEVDFFPLQERTVHYLIFKYPGVSLDDAINKACHNYQQMKEIPGLTVDFYFLDPKLNHRNSYSSKFDLENKLTAEEFCAEYMKDEKASLTKSDSSASSQDKSDKKTKESKMMLGPLIRKGTYSLMCGDKGSGKTSLATLIAASVATGKEFVQVLRPERDMPKRVLFLDFELGEHDFMQGAKYFCKNTSEKLTKDDLPFDYEDKAGLGINIYSKDGFVEIKETVSAYENKIKLLIIDNITALSTGNAGKDKDGWSQLVYPYIRKLNKIGISVIILAHLNGAKVRGEQQKFLNAQDYIVVERTDPAFHIDLNKKEKKVTNEKATIGTDIIQTTISKPYGAPKTPFDRDSLRLAINKHAKSPKWEFDDQYLKHILLSDCSTDDLEIYFNTTAKTIRDWWKKQFPGTKRKNRKKLRN